MINKVILVGNLGQDPELKNTGGGTAVVKISIATTERRKDKDGNWGNHTEWHTVVAFGRMAENIDEFCRKGKQLYVEGRLQTRKWQDKDGHDRWTTEIVADDVRFLGGRDGGGEAQAESGGRSSAGRGEDRGARGGSGSGQAQGRGGSGGGQAQGRGGSGGGRGRQQQEPDAYADSDIPF